MSAPRRIPICNCGHDASDHHLTLRKTCRKCKCCRLSCPDCAYCAKRLRRAGWRWYTDYMGGRHRLHAGCFKVQVHNFA